MSSANTAGDAPFRNVLVALDGSDSSTRVLETAAELARRCGARLTLLHVINPPAAFDPAMAAACAEAEGDLIVRALEMLHRLSERLPEGAAGAAGVVAQRVVSKGRPADGIVAEARRRGTDLLVVGDHNRGALSRFLLGSTADAVVRHAPCPVLVVRPRERGKERPVAEGAGGAEAGEREGAGNGADAEISGDAEHCGAGAAGEVASTGG